jgi:Flp pilus assembly protein CpaB
MEMDSSRRRRLILMTLGIVLAVVAGGIAFVLAQQPSGGEPVATTPVLVAARDIEARTTLTADDLTVEQLPTNAVVPQAYTTIDEAIGRVTSIRILADQQITPNFFVGGVVAPGGSPIPWSILDPEETVAPDSPYWRAVAVQVPRNRAVAGQLRAGDRIDLLVTVQFANPVQPVEDEDGNLSYEEVDSALALVDPETGEIRGIVGGQATKLTFTDLEILEANTEDNLYILKVDLHQAEQINHVALVAPDSFSIVLRPGQDTRAINTDEYGETTDRVIMQYLYPVPELVDLATLLGLVVEPIPAPPQDGASPSPEPEPEPEPSPSP